MLALKTLRYLHPPSLPLKASRLRPSSSPLSLPRRPLSISAAAMAPTSTTVEHVVLFKVRDAADPSKMVSGLNSLTSLGLASSLAAGPLLRLRSAASADLGFTHLLLTRFPSKLSLAEYSAHPDHLSVVRSHVLPICDDVMAVDWESFDLSGPVQIPPGSAVRLTLVKPKEGAAKAEVLDAVRVSAGEVPGVGQVSLGENFSPARAKGYEIGFLAVFPGVEEMERMETEGGDLLEKHKEKVRPLLESVIVVDFVVPALVAASASL